VQACLSQKLWLTENSCCYTCSAPITRKEIKVVVGNCSPSRSQQVPPPPDLVSRGVTTRNLARTLAQLEEANTATIPDPVPLNASGAQSSALDASQSTIQVEGIASRPIRGRPRAGRPARTTNTRRNQTVDYNTIQEMIEQTVNTVISSLSIHNRPQSNNRQVSDMNRES